MAERVLIVGTGLIGGSVGLALRAAGTHVTGVDRDPDAVRRAVEVGAVDEATADLATACGAANMIVVATPVGAIVETIAAIATVAAPGTVVTDVGSTKRAIVDRAETLLGGGAWFVGGHPMAGSERDGVDAARADLFEGALWILTPTKDTEPDAFRRVNALVSQVGAKTLALDPDEHDRLVALVSHLPYAIATTLMELASVRGDDRVFRAAAGSFRDMTRTAGSNPRVWRDILSANREALLAELDAYAGHLVAFRDALDASDWNALDGFIERARATRKRLPLKGERAPASPFVVEVSVSDRAGALAEVTTAVGELGINIEDLWMDHHESGGVVKLVVDGAIAAERTAELLRGRRFRVAVAEVEV